MKKTYKYSKLFKTNFNCGIDTVKITTLPNHKPGILNNYIRISYHGLPKSSICKKQ